MLPATSVLKSIPSKSGSSPMLTFYLLVITSYTQSIARQVPALNKSPVVVLRRWNDSCIWQRIWCTRKREKNFCDFRISKIKFFKNISEVHKCKYILSYFHFLNIPTSLILLSYLLSSTSFVWSWNGLVNLVSVLLNVNEPLLHILQGKCWMSVPIAIQITISRNWSKSSQCFPCVAVVYHSFFIALKVKRNT